jgi:hypothetical protein
MRGPRWYNREEERATIMAIDSMIRDIFGHFQNLNLLALLYDLDQDRAAREVWASGSLLCPVAHGLPAGQQVQQLNLLGITGLSKGCKVAARHLGAPPRSVQRFVRLWDAGALSRPWLLHQLYELWQERLTDAEAVQELLQCGYTHPEAAVVQQ